MHSSRLKSGCLPEGQSWQVAADADAAPTGAKVPAAHLVPEQDAALPSDHVPALATKPTTTVQRRIRQLLEAVL